MVYNDIINKEEVPESYVETMRKIVVKITLERQFRVPTYFIENDFDEGVMELLFDSLNSTNINYWHHNIDLYNLVHASKVSLQDLIYKVLSKSLHYLLDKEDTDIVPHLRLYGKRLTEEELFCSSHDVFKNDNKEEIIILFNKLWFFDPYMILHVVRKKMHLHRNNPKLYMEFLLNYISYNITFGDSIGNNNDSHLYNESYILMLIDKALSFYVKKSKEYHSKVYNADDAFVIPLLNILTKVNNRCHCIWNGYGHLYKVFLIYTLYLKDKKELSKKRVESIISSQSDIVEKYYRDYGGYLRIPTVDNVRMCRASYNYEKGPVLSNEFIKDYMSELEDTINRYNEEGKETTSLINDVMIEVYTFTEANINNITMSTSLAYIIKTTKVYESSTVSRLLNKLRHNIENVFLNITKPLKSYKLIGDFYRAVLVNTNTIPYIFTDGPININIFNLGTDVEDYMDEYYKFYGMGAMPWLLLEQVLPTLAVTNKYAALEIYNSPSIKNLKIIVEGRQIKPIKYSIMYVSSGRGNSTELNALYKLAFSDKDILDLPDEDVVDHLNSIGYDYSFTYTPQSIGRIVDITGNYNTNIIKALRVQIFHHPENLKYIPCKMMYKLVTGEDVKTVIKSIDGRYIDLDKVNITEFGEDRETLPYLTTERVLDTINNKIDAYGYIYDLPSTYQVYSAIGKCVDMMENNSK